MRGTVSGSTMCFGCPCARLTRPFFCRVYNNHIFIDHEDVRLGADAAVNFDDASGYEPVRLVSSPPFVSREGWHLHHFTATNRSTQSLPDFDNPCNRTWGKYFASNATIKTWFTDIHTVNQQQYMADCNQRVVSWRQGVHQIRWASAHAGPLVFTQTQQALPGP